MISEESFELTQEQKFSLKVYELNSCEMSKEQLREMLLAALSQLMVQKNIAKELIKKSINGGGL